MWHMQDKVGDKIEVQVSNGVKLAFAAALYNLHVDDIIHGDPRIEMLCYW